MKFQKGNKIGNRFKPGESGNPLGKPKGTKNLKLGKPPPPAFELLPEVDCFFIQEKKF